MLNIMRGVGPTSGYVGLAALFAAVCYYIIFGNWSVVAQALLGLAVVALALYIWAERRTVISTLGSRQAKRGSNSAVLFAAFLGIVALVNFLGARHSIRWDLTESGIHTLSSQTLNVLSSLQQPVHVIGFYQDGDSRRQAAADLLKEYASRSDRLTYEFVDPDLKPTLAQQYQIRDYVTVFVSGDKNQQVVGTTESDFTSALIKLSSAQPKKVAFVTGHGEHALDATDNASYQQAKAALEADNYTVTTLTLASGPVPDDVSAVVLAGPRQPLLDQERQALRDYLGKGGKVLLLTDPGIDAQLDDIVAGYGVSLSSSYVIDRTQSLYPDAGTPVITRYGWSPITKDLPETAFPGVAPLTLPQQPSTGVTVTPLAMTSDSSWGETDIKNPGYSEGVDSQGPLTIAATIEADIAPADGQTQGDQPAKKARLVLIGDSDFASNAYLRAGGNRDMLVNSVNWLTESEDLISIRPQVPEDRGVYLSTTQANMIWLSSVVILPLAVLLAGVSVWWSRR